MEWINIKQEPPNSKRFLALLHDKQIVVLKKNDDEEDSYNTDGWEDCHYCGGQSQACIDNTKEYLARKIITHWLPLPQFPKDKDV